MIILREIIDFLSNVFFVVMGGVPIMNTVWVLPYILLIAVIMISPMLYILISKKTKWKFVIGFIGCITFFPFLMIGMGLPLTQMRMLSECETVSVTVQTENVENQEIYILQCRYKENYYDDFGEWGIANQSR